MNKPSTLALIILDGFGYREETEHNAIAAANTPHWDALWQQHPHLLIEGSGHYVGLPDQQMGNSEVGHLNIGAGRIVYQDYTRISEAIDNKEFFENPVLLEAMAKVKQQDSALHIIGLVSPGGVHSHEEHIHALIDLAQQQQLSDINLHAFLDGRDTPPQSAEASLLRFEEHFHRIGSGQIASLVGRYYAMDRDKRWDRIQAAYDLLTLGTAHRHATTACLGLEQAYHDGETDEFVKPTCIHAEDAEPITIKDNDVVIFMNFRADRARQISYAFTADDFHGFEREVYPDLADFVSLTQYADDLKVCVAYPPQSLDNTLGEVIAKQGLKQLRIAETEKYAHVTFFFNGGKEAEFAGEGRLLIPSPQVATYDLQPKMSAPELTDKLVAAIEKQQFDVIICNFANPDMVGHTGNFPAAVQAVETIDQCIGRIMEALHTVKGEMLLTADHGNVEYMFNEETGQAHTAHTSNPVPLCYYSQRQAHFCEDHGKLSDIAPTMLSLLGIEIPEEMTGKNLIQLD